MYDQTALLSLCSCMLLWHEVTASDKQPIIGCGKNNTLKSQSLILYELEGHDAFVKVWSPYGQRDSQLPVWSVNVRQSDTNVTIEEVKSAMIVHYSALTVYHMETRFNNIKFQYNLPSVNNDSVYTSGWLTLRIGYAPKVSHRRIIEIDAVRGDKFPKTCFGIVGSPMPTFSIFKLLENNSAIQLDTFKYRFHADCIQMELLSPHDNGLYRVVAENCFGKDFIKFSLSIKAHPSIKIAYPTSEKRSLTVIQGSNLVIGYNVTGSPELRTTWFYERESLINNSRISYNWTHLVVKNVSATDAGLYTIVVKNSIGSDHNCFFLLVQSDTPATASSGDGGELWLTTVGTSIVSGLIGALIAALLVFRKMRSLKQTRTITSPLDNNSEYCEMHRCPGGRQPAWVRPYSISKVPGCLEVAGYWIPDTTTNQTSDRSQESTTEQSPHPCSNKYENTGHNNETQQNANDNTPDPVNSSSNRGHNHGYVNVPNDQTVEATLTSGQ